MAISFTSESLATQEQHGEKKLSGQRPKSGADAPMLPVSDRGIFRQKENVFRPSIVLAPVISVRPSGASCARYGIKEPFDVEV